MLAQGQNTRGILNVSVIAVLGKPSDNLSYRLLKLSNFKHHMMHNERKHQAKSIDQINFF